MKLIIDPETQKLITKAEMLKDFKAEYEDIHGKNTLESLNKDQFRVMFSGWLTGLIEGELVMILDSESELYAFEDSYIPIIDRQ